MRFFAIIPARYASTRFPGKPLAEIMGKTMIRRVYEQALKAKSITAAIVATDDQRIYDHVAGFGRAIMTSASHPSGTDRCFEAASAMKEEWNLTNNDIIVNVQGDEPFIQPDQIDLICQCFTHDEVEIATLCKPITNHHEIHNENVVKVVSQNSGFALYFSRNPIPFVRGVQKDEWPLQQIHYKHIGMYAYRFNVLSKITSLNPSNLEIAESLEQLRWLENGFRIAVEKTNTETLAVDTPADLQRLLAEKM